MLTNPNMQDKILLLFGNNYLKRFEDVFWNYVGQQIGAFV